MSQLRAGAIYLTCNVPPLGTWCPPRQSGRSGRGTRQGRTRRLIKLYENVVYYIEESWFVFYTSRSGDLSVVVGRRRHHGYVSLAAAAEAVLLRGGGGAHAHHHLQRKENFKIN